MFDSLKICLREGSIQSITSSILQYKCFLFMTFYFKIDSKWWLYHFLLLFSVFFFIKPIRYQGQFSTQLYKYVTSFVILSKAMNRQTTSTERNYTFARYILNTCSKKKRNNNKITNCFWLDNICITYNSAPNVCLFSLVLPLLSY